MGVGPGAGVGHEDRDHPAAVRQRLGPVATTRTGSDGVFNASFAARGNATYRARVSGGPTSLPYDSRPIPAKRTHLFTP